MSGASDKPTRIQSPSYPYISLREAVGAVAKIEGRYRSSTLDRVDAAKLLGFTGVTGPSNMTLATLASFGLIEKAGKGELRVTELARSILHPSSEEEKKLALRQAASGPQLYQELRERFADVAVPSEEGVHTYLNRLGFNPTAVRPAAKAFLQTMSYMQEVGVSESRGALVLQPQNAAPALTREELMPMHVSPPLQTAQMMAPHAVSSSAVDAELTLNEPTLNIRGGTVRVAALLDYDGLSELENQIKALRMILKPKRSGILLPKKQPDDGSDEPDLEDMLA